MRHSHPRQNIVEKGSVDQLRVIQFGQSLVVVFEGSHLFRCR